MKESCRPGKHQRRALDQRLTGPLYPRHAPSSESPRRAARLDVFQHTASTISSGSVHIPARRHHSIKCEPSGLISTRVVKDIWFFLVDIRGRFPVSDRRKYQFVHPLRPIDRQFRRHFRAGVVTTIFAFFIPRLSMKLIRLRA